MFNGRVGVIIEVAPNQFFQYVLKEVDARIDLDRGVDERMLITETVMSGPTYVTMELRGRLVDHEEAARPEWATAPAAEIEARRELGSR
jgi:hypothetical protein